jgi:hypothetical protein
MGGPKSSQNAKADSLEAFAIRVQRAVEQANPKDSEAMERLVARVLTSEANPALAATMAVKWVEWRYGKPKQPLTGDKENPVTVQFVTNVDLPPI